ncbi:hypothetical protein V7S43_013402 [Phytophthora oleae]|uniref:Crinkler effector protein N-terminal domain-containing protein n=1 Tax=Phytophthora oleae TaxID=2107226 RepID=A0ABD3F4J6_9STRA
MVEDLKEPIKTEYSDELKDVDEGELLLFLTKKAGGTWLSADDTFKETELDMENGSVPDVIDSMISDEHMRLDGRDTIAAALGRDPPSKYLHLLVKTPCPNEPLRPRKVLLCPITSALRIF